jgi:hypothetical protein
VGSVTRVYAPLSIFNSQLNIDKTTDQETLPIIFNHMRKEHRIAYLVSFWFANVGIHNVGSTEKQLWSHSLRNFMVMFPSGWSFLGSKGESSRVLLRL